MGAILARDGFLHVTYRCCRAPGRATAAWADSIEDKAALCGACHGVNGVPEDPTTPIIWGQNAGYLYLQFRDFQKGARKDYRMTPIAQYVVKPDALALAEYFSAKTWPNTGAPAASKADTDVAIAVNKSVVCTSCHSRAIFSVTRPFRAFRWARARLPLENHDGLPRPHARQQSQHVGSHEHRHARAALRNRRLSGWALGSDPNRALAPVGIAAVEDDAVHGRNAAIPDRRRSRGNADVLSRHVR